MIWVFSGTSENSELVCQAFVEIFKWSAQMKITISSKIIHTQFLSLQDEVMAHTTTNSVYELTVVSKFRHMVILIWL